MSLSKKIIGQMLKLSAEADEQAKIDYPVGRLVSWNHGDHKRSGRVIAHGYGQRLKVFSDKTKKEQWVSICRLHQ